MACLCDFTKTECKRIMNNETTEQEPIDVPKMKPICIIFTIAMLIIVGFFWGLGFVTATRLFGKGGS